VAFLLAALGQHIGMRSGASSLGRHQSRPSLDALVYMRAHRNPDDDEVRELEITLLETVDKPMHI
jgi:hypothetical protein